MEETHYLMWMKRKQNMNSSFSSSHVQASFGVNYSWEEKAFAEDAARILGGCIWPPRSYSCNFCKRDFKSAQALGGHMNVHRRDRARLKQSQNDDLALHHHHHKNDCKSSSSSLGVQFSSDSSCRSSTLYSTDETFGQKIMSPPNCSSISWGQNKGCHDSEIPKGLVNIAKREDFFKGLGCNDYVETSLAVGKSSMFGQKLPSEDKGISYKRAKTTGSVSSLPEFLKTCSNDRLLTLQSAEFVLGLKPGMEDLDLELRLGKQQKVI